MRIGLGLYDSSHGITNYLYHSKIPTYNSLLLFRRLSFIWPTPNAVVIICSRVFEIALFHAFHTPM